MHPKRMNPYAYVPAHLVSAISHLFTLQVTYAKKKNPLDTFMKF